MNGSIGFQAIVFDIIFKTTFLMGALPLVSYNIMLLSEAQLPNKCFWNREINSFQCIICWLFDISVLNNMSVNRIKQVLHVWLSTSRIIKATCRIINATNLNWVIAHVMNAINTPLESANRNGARAVPQVNAFASCCKYILVPMMIYCLIIRLQFVK